MKQDMKQSTAKIPEGYKNTLLGIIPNEWEVKKIKEIGQVVTGNTPATSEKENYGDSYLFVSPVDLSDLKYIKNTEKKLSLIGFEKSRKLPKGAVLFTCIGLIGKVGISLCDLSCNQQINAIICNELMFNEYLYYELRIRASKIKLIAGEQVLPIINKSDFENVKILIPPLPEQRKIAEVLSTWDKAIEKQTLLVEKLELRKKGLMQQLLTGKKRLHEFNGEWKKEKLGKLFDERNETKMQSLPLLSITADKGIISQTASEKKDTSNEDKSKYKRICPGDIGYNTMRMWQGRCALSKLEGIVSPAYTIVSPHNDVNPFYMEMLFKQPFMIYRFWTHSQGLVNDTLNCKYPAFSQVKVTIPKIEEQNAIAEILSFCDKEIALAKQKLDTLRQQKKGLMQVLLTGKKRI